MNSFCIRNAVGVVVTLFYYAVNFNVKWSGSGTTDVNVSYDKKLFEENH